MTKTVKSVTSHIMLRGFKRTMALSQKFRSARWCFALLVIAGCQSVPKPDQFFQPVSLEERSIQTRIYATDDEVKILGACADLLLDNGFQIREVDSRLGWIVASKTKQIQNVPHWILANVVTRQVRGGSEAVAVRVIFYQWQKVDDPDSYQEFFSKLSKALFLEAQQI